MSGASFCIGLLPGYATIGLAAPAALLALRMVQGFSASGEYAGAATFLAEYTHNRKRGIVSSIVPASTAIGLLCGSALFSLESALLSEADMAAWGWRIPFLMAGPLDLIAHAIRTRLAESPAFEAMHEASEVDRAPLSYFRLPARVTDAPACGNLSSARGSTAERGQIILDAAVAGIVNLCRK